MSDVFSHRNGEEEVPAVNGYFWFNGYRKVPDDDGDMTDELRPAIGLVYINADRAPLILMDTVVGDNQFTWHQHGNWWGPVSAPWGDSQKSLWQPVEAQEPDEPAHGFFAGTGELAYVSEAKETSE